MKFRFVCPIDKPVKPENVSVQRIPLRFLDEIQYRILDEVGTIDGVLTESEAVRMIPAACAIYELSRLVPEGLQIEARK